MKRLGEILEEIRNDSSLKKLKFYINRSQITLYSEDYINKEIIRVGYRYNESSQGDLDISICNENHTLLSLHYTEFKSCCGKVIIHTFSSNWNAITIDRQPAIKLIDIIFNLAFSSARTNKYGFASFVISNTEQPDLLHFVINNEKLYDNKVEFNNPRNNHTCTDFTKILT